MSLEDLLGGSSFGALSPYDDPREFARYRANQGLLGLSAGLLAGSGPSRLPVGLGQALGQGLLGMQQFQRAANEDALNSAKVPLYKAQAEKTKTEVDLVKAQTQEALRKAALTGNLGPALMQFITGAGGSGSGSGAAAPGGTPMSMSKDGVVPTPAEGMLSLGDMKAAALRAGFEGPNADIAAAIGQAESSGNPNAANEKGEHSYGIMQINADAHGPVAREALGNPDKAMELAYRISKGGTDFSPWTMYKNGQYKQYLGGAAASPIEQFNAKMRGPQLAQAGAGTMTDMGGGDVSGSNQQVAIGDSIAAHLIRKAGVFGQEDATKIRSFRPGDTAVSGAAPSEILGLVIPSIPDEAIKGKNVLLSTGLSNNPTQVDLIQKQIEALRGRGAAGVTVLGVGTSPKLNGINDQLAQIATDNGATFAGPLAKVGGDGIHSSDPRAVLAQATAASAPPPQPLPAQFAQQQAAAAPPAAGPRQLMPGGAAFSVPGVPAVPPVPAAPNMDPRRMAAMGAMAQLGGLPDVMKPFETYYYGSPGYKGQVAGAEAAGKYPYDISQEILKQRLAAALAGPTKKAQEEATYPFTIGAQMSQGDINRESERLKQVQAAGLELGPLTIGGNTQPATRQQQVDWTTKGIRPPQFGPAPGPAAQGLGQALATPQSGTQVLTKAEEGRVAQQAAGYDKVSEDATAAEKGFAPLTALHNAMLNFRTGPGRETQLNLTKTWQTAAEMLGAKPDSDLAKWIASGEIIKKEGTSLGFELARTLGSRESQMIIQQAIATNPGLANSVGGNEKLIEVIQQGLQRELDKRTFYDNWFNAHGHSYEGAAGAFQKAAPAEQYISKALPFQPKDKDAYDALRPGSTYIDPTGVTRLKPYSPEWSAHMPQ